ncbi:GMC family oxidoreductase [Gammaproteobacteria bacterium 45_16_T64]|nr:GMC family oxidoreductase [Gammaproteobacteria bacterium 45_16_T64]
MIKEISGIKDIIQEGIKSGWKTWSGSRLEKDLTLEADVVIIGTGAGGGTAGEILSKAGLKVIMVEEGPLKSSNSFDMQEDSAYSDLYQEGMARGSKDGAFTIMQGRCVGGSTTVNWTSSFRTPEHTLHHWTEQHNLQGFSPSEMAPWFEMMEKRLNIGKWQQAPNANNQVLADGCSKLGYDWKVIPRNVSGCWNIGYCGLGCPTNAKQSMLVTTIPETLNHNGELVFSALAEQLIIKDDKVTGVVCKGIKEDGVTPSGRTVTINAKHTVMACGGINGPGLLLRSNAPDPHELIGKRTFLHPVTFSVSEFKDKIEGYYGAPQSTYSDHFQWMNGATGPISYKLEVNPMQPAMMAAVIMGHGEQHREQMLNLSRMNSMIALLRDGFDEQSQGGSIELRPDNSPVVDYAFNDYLVDGLKRSLITMAEIQFAAGASRVRPVHTCADFVSTLAEAKKQIQRLDFSPNSIRVGSAHVMGGCAMGANEKEGVVNAMGQAFSLENLSILDGSTFPTSIGANPQLSIYGMVAKQATALAKQLT